MAIDAQDREVLGDEVLARFESDLNGALKRRPAQEAKLAGALRVLALYSPRLRQSLSAALDVMVRRNSFERPLYVAAACALAEARHGETAAQLSRALASENAGGLSTLCAASFLPDRELSAPLAKLAASRHAHVAFAAEVARVARGESTGAHIASVAPKIKESHRIELCVHLLVPLLWQRPLSIGIAPALAVLREAERHLGRWLVLGEIATRAGDETPLAQARERTKTGPSSARAAWAFVAWALAESAEPPTLRPSLELVARLSDRPSADRDPTFLFRLATARAESARPMLEMLAKAPLSDESAVRAALHLARDYGEPRYRGMLGAAADSTRRTELRGLATAALFDAGDTERALESARALVAARTLSGLAWGALTLTREQSQSAAPLVTEPTFRRMQLGWVE